MKSFSNFLLSLNRGAIEKPIGEFKDWALDETKSIIPFDSCVWGAGSWIDGQPTLHSIHLHNLDAGFTSSWLQYQHEDTLVRKMRENLDRTFNVDCAETFSGTSIYEFHCKRFAMEHIVATATIDPDTLLFNSMSFYRSNPGAPFSEKDRSLKEILFPHLVAAVQTNWLTNLPHLLSAHQRSTFNSIAACDTLGVLRLAMPSFVETCRLEWPMWKGPTLPECVQETMQSGELKFVGKRIVVSMLQLDGLLLLRARPTIPADGLSPRELEVAQRFAAGTDHKTIAQEMMISPSTVRVYLNKIYTKLDIHEKASLVAKLRQMTH